MLMQLVGGCIYPVSVWVSTTCAYAASALYKREKRKDGEKERELETKKEREIGRGGGMTRNDARGKRVPFINAYQRSVSVM